MHMSDGDMLDSERVGREVGRSATDAFDWYLVSLRASIGDAPFGPYLPKLVALDEVLPTSSRKLF
jgi:hypothetical protein